VIVNKTIALIKREYLLQVKSKGFIIGTLLLPLFILFVSFVPAFLANMEVEKKANIAVIDTTGKIYTPLSVALQESRKDKQGNSLYNVEQVTWSGDSLGIKKEELNARVQNGELFAYIEVTDSVFIKNSFAVYSKNITNFDFYSRVERLMSDAVKAIRMNESGLDPELVNKLSQWVKVQTFQVDEKGASEASGMAAYGLSYVMVFILYFALIMYGAYVMQGVIEDKSSRVMEVILSSVKPYQLMAGKIIGIGATGLTQFFIWILSTVLVTTFGLVIAQQFAPGISELAIPSLSIWTYLAFIAYFLLGFFLYATLYAGLGSMVNSSSEAQSVQWPVMMLIVVAFLLMFAIIKTPDSTLAVVLSLIPFFTPLLMFMRIMLNAVPLYQVILSIIITLLTIGASIWVSGKIFRVGILMYGKRPTLPELLKWIKY